MMIKNIDKIKNIVFDLGNVILNVDFQATETEFKKSGFENFEELYTRARQIKLFDQLETGIISPDKFRDELKRMTNIPVSDEMINYAWNKMILDFPEERIRFLEKLKQNYRVFLLSNTNKIHFDYYTDNFRKQFGYNFSDLFEKMYVSFEVGMRKPNRDIFEFLLRESNLIPEETLFIDDTAEHVEAALKCNINAYVLKEHEEIYEILNS